MPSPRALMGAAPALIVLAGSFVLSRECLREAGPAGSARQGAVRSEVVVWPSATDEERLHRVALKQETIDDLMDGQLTLSEAVERFETLSASGEALANLRSVSGDTDSERMLNQVISFARIRTAQDPQRYGAVLARLEAEARSPAGPLRTN